MAVPSAASITYVDFERHIVEVGGSRNINEFLPYTVISVFKKLLEIVLVLGYQSYLRHHELTAQNGVNFSLEAVNVVNAVSIAGASLALIVLVALSIANLLALKRCYQRAVAYPHGHHPHQHYEGERVAAATRPTTLPQSSTTPTTAAIKGDCAAPLMGSPAAVAIERFLPFPDESRPCDDPPKATMDEVAAARAAIQRLLMRDWRFRLLVALHTLAVAVAGLINGTTVAWVALSPSGTAAAMTDLAKASAVATVALAFSKNAVDGFFSALRCVRTLRAHGRLTTTPISPSAADMPSSAAARHLNVGEPSLPPFLSQVPVDEDGERGGAHTVVAIAARLEKEVDKNRGGGADARQNASMIRVAFVIRLRRVLVIERLRCLSLALVATAFGVLLLGLLGQCPLPLMLAMYLSCSVVGQGIGIALATPCVKRYLSIAAFVRRHWVSAERGCCDDPSVVQQAKGDDARVPRCCDLDLASDGDVYASVQRALTTAAADGGNGAAVASIVASLPRGDVIGPVLSQLCCGCDDSWSRPSESRGGVTGLFDGPTASCRRGVTWMQQDPEEVRRTGCYDLGRNVLS